jgi:glycosyltransferase
VTKWAAGEFSQQKLKYGWMPPHPTVFLRKSVYENIGGFDLRFRISSDYDLILRAFTSSDFKSKYIPQLMVQMLLGGLSNRSWKNIGIKMVEDYSIMIKNQLPAMPALILKNASKCNQLRRLF